MLSIQPLDEARDKSAALSGTDPAAYEKKTFGMFGGREERVTLRCAERLAGVFFDRFGTELITRRVDGGFEISVPVIVSPLFYSWLMSFGDEVRIVEPRAVAGEFCALARAALKGYEEERA